MSQSLIIKVLALTFITANVALAGQGQGKRGGGPQLTDTQRTCLDSKVGKPSEGRERPTKEVMDAAMKKCGVEAPTRRASSYSSNGDSAKYIQLTEAYLASSDSATQEARREDLKALYFKTKDQNLQQQIQAFLSSHLPASVASSIETNSVSQSLSTEGGSR